MNRAPRPSPAADSGASRGHAPKRFLCAAMMPLPRTGGGTRPHVDLSLLAAHGRAAARRRASCCLWRLRPSWRQQQSRGERFLRGEEAASASAVETCVPLIRARPSFGPSSIGFSPAASSPSRADIRLPREQRRRRRSGPSQDAERRQVSDAQPSLSTGSGIKRRASGGRSASRRSRPARPNARGPARRL